MSRRHRRRAAARRRLVEVEPITPTDQPTQVETTGPQPAGPEPAGGLAPMGDTPATDPSGAATTPTTTSTGIGAPIPLPRAAARRASNRYFCRWCSRIQRAELPPAGWLRVQIASDPELTRNRAAGWSSTDAGGLFCGLACLIAWAAAAHDTEQRAEAAHR